jgi:hypothetical protein
MFRQTRVLLALTTLACSSSVELSTAPHLTASSDPTVLGVINEQVSAIAVDEERIYWSGGPGEAHALRSCRKQDCAGSLLTYDPSQSGAFGLANGEIYWTHREDSNAQDTWALLACSVSGCRSGPRTVAVDIVGIVNIAVDSFVFTADTAYFSTGYQIWRIPLAGNRAEPESFLASGGPLTAFAAQGDYIYWLGWARSSAVQRTRKDGTGAIEVLAENLDIAPHAGLALDATHVYWSEGTLYGSILRCPLSGCVGAPEVFAAPIRSPTTLQLDGARLYWQHDTMSLGLAVSSCSLGACVPADPIVHGVEASNALAIDDQYLYTATTDAMLDDDAWLNHPSAQIRRISKERRAQ